MVTQADVAQVLFAVGLILPPLYAFRLKRKFDIFCFLFASYLGIGFLYSIFFFEILTNKVELIPETVSSLIIACLTLALVWVELDKRPELVLINPVPMAYDKESQQGSGFSRADTEMGRVEVPSWRKIGKASFPGTKLIFDKNFAFAVELTNLGNQAIMVSQFLIKVDGKTVRSEEYRQSLVNEQIETISTGFLGIDRAGFHSVYIEAKTATTKIWNEVWLCVSNDYTKIKYIRVWLIHKFFAPLIKHQLTK